LNDDLNKPEESLMSLIGRRARILDVGALGDPVLKRMLEWAVGRVGKITNLEMAKDLDGRRKPFFTITLWYSRRGVGLKSENFYLKPSQIEVLPDRRRKQKDK